MSDRSLRVRPESSPVAWESWRRVLDQLPAPSPTDTCPLCGWTRSQAQTTGLLGCGVCYSSLFPWDEPEARDTP
jgi:hypothetical protein